MYSEIVSINSNEVSSLLGNKLLHDKDVEEVLIREYSYDRTNGIDYVTMLKDEFLKLGFNATRDEIKSGSIVSDAKFISITYSILDKLDIILLMQVKRIDFKNITFKNSTVDEFSNSLMYNFEVTYVNK